MPKKNIQEAIEERNLQCRLLDLAGEHNNADEANNILRQIRVLNTYISKI